MSLLLYLKEIILELGFKNFKMIVLDLFLYNWIKIVENLWELVFR